MQEKTSKKVPTLSIPKMQRKKKFFISYSEQGSLDDPTTMTKKRCSLQRMQLAIYGINQCVSERKIYINKVVLYCVILDVFGIYNHLISIEKPLLFCDFSAQNYPFQHTLRTVLLFKVEKRNNIMMMMRMRRLRTQSAVVYTIAVTFQKLIPIGVIS